MFASQLLWKLVSQLIKEEFASGKLQILLVHAVAAFETGHDHRRGTLKKSKVRIKLCRQLSAHLRSAIITERWQLIGLGALVEQDSIRGCHAVYLRPLWACHHAWDQLATASADWTEHLGRRHSNMLRLIVLSCALTLVLGLLSGGFLITILQIGVDVLGNAVNLVLHLGKTLDPILINYN